MICPRDGSLMREDTEFHAQAKLDGLHRRYTNHMSHYHQVPADQTGQRG